MDYKPELKPYPSGFIGSNKVTQTMKVKDNVNVNNVNMFFNTFSDSQVSPHSSSLEVNSLFERFSNNTEMDVFDFNESVIVLSLKSFGTNTFFDWLSKQYINLEYTYVNHKFIDETIQFIFYNKAREMTFLNWRSILIGNKVETITKQYTDIQQDYLNNFPSMNMVDFIRLWVSKDGGVADLLNTLMVLFGKRD